LTALRRRERDQIEVSTRTIMVAFDDALPCNHKTGRNRPSRSPIGFSAVCAALRIPAKRSLPLLSSTYAHPAAGLLRSVCRLKLDSLPCVNYYTSDCVAPCQIKPGTVSRPRPGTTERSTNSMYPTPRYLPHAHLPGRIRSCPSPWYWSPQE